MRDEMGSGGPDAAARYLAAELDRCKEDFNRELDLLREDMAKSLDTFLQQLRNELASVQRIKEEITKNPPWGRGRIPTRIETDRKIDDLLQETASLVKIEPPEALSHHDKIAKIREWNAVLASRKSEELEQS